MEKQQPQRTSRPANDLVREDILRREELGGLSRSAFYNLRHRSDFPKPYPVTQRTVLYSRSATRQWLEERRGA